MKCQAAGIQAVLLVSLLLLAVTGAAAGVIQKWQTPGGTLYFGDRPPE